VRARSHRQAIGLRGALERFGEMEAGGGPGAGKKYADRFEVVLRARDGVAHIGAHGGAADQVAELAIRGAQENLHAMGRSLEEFFGDWVAPARALLDEHATKVHQTGQLRLSRARDAFAQRFAGHGAGDRDTQLAALDIRAGLEDDTKHAVRCPACGQYGILTGENLLHDEPDWDVADGDTYISGIAATVQLSVHAFSCPVCGLRLHGAEQLSEAGLDTTVDVRDGTTEDLEAYTLARQTDTWEREPDAD
jgi:predicted RNA-binding Zn-ribbon protein involved in translation (DUF1610 family)